MPRNGSGQYNPLTNTWNPPVTGVLATGTDFQAQLNDISAAITQSVSKDGQTPMTANLPMNNNSIVGLATGTNSSPSISPINDTNTGVYFPAADTVGVAVGGVNVGNFTSTGFSGNSATATNLVNGNATLAAGTASTPSLTTTGDTNTGLYFPAADTVGVAVGGVNVGNFTSAGFSGNSATATNATNATNLVNGNATLAAGTASTPSLTTTGDTNTGLYFPAADTVGVAVGGVQALLIDSTGIEVPAGTASTPSLTTTGDTNTGLYFPAADTVAIATGGTEYARLTSDGNLGIATTSPTSKLSVAGWVSDQWAGAGDGLGLNGCFGSGISTISTYLDASSIRIGAGKTQKTGILITGESTSSGSTVQFSTGGSERARLTYDGNLLINTTAAIERFTVNGWASINGQSNIGNFASTIVTNCNGNSWYGIMVQNQSVNNSNAMTFCNASTSVVGSITMSNSGTSFNTASDYRLKEDVQPMTGALAKVAALKPCTYKWKIDGTDGEGFIAHELQEVCPSAVSGEKDAVNEDGSIKPQGIDTSFLVATLTAALQEAHGLIKDLQSRVDALEAK